MGRIAGVSEERHSARLAELPGDRASDAPAAPEHKGHSVAQVNSQHRPAPRRAVRLTTTPFSGGFNPVHEIQVIASNEVIEGPFIEVSAEKLSYHPDQVGTAHIEVNPLTPFCKEVRLVLNLDAPGGNVIFISDGIYMITDQWSLEFTIPSDAESGEWNLNITAFGLAGEAVLWFSSDDFEFRVTGNNT